MVAWGNGWLAGAGMDYVPRTPKVSVSYGEVWEGRAWICIVPAFHGRALAAVNSEFVFEQTSVFIIAAFTARADQYGHLRKVAGMASKAVRYFASYHTPKRQISAALFCASAAYLHPCKSKQISFQTNFKCHICVNVSYQSFL